FTVHERVVLIRRAFDDELAALIDDPRPAAAEAPDGGRLELLLELVEAAERAVERVGDGAGRCTARLRSHDLPEHRVIEVAPAVVAHRRPHGLGHAVDALDQILEAL